MVPVVPKAQSTVGDRRRPALTQAGGGFRLRLASDAADPLLPQPTPQVPAQSQIQGATDPRWVLALRTAEQLQGSILTPDRRQRLQQTGRLLGLTAFDCSLVIAIVQDQARRGVPPMACPQAGQVQLSLVPLPRRSPLLAWPSGNWVMPGLVAVVLLLEVILLRTLWG